MKIVETANEIAELKKGSKSLNPKYCNGMLGYGILNIIFI
jgi:hypothetical protein